MDRATEAILCARLKELEAERDVWRSAALDVRDKLKSVLEQLKALKADSVALRRIIEENSRRRSWADPADEINRTSE